jgi:hypothetical protein
MSKKWNRKKKLERRAMGRRRWLSHPDRAAYDAVVKEEYERAKKAFEARKAVASDGLQPAGLAGD